MSPLSVLLDWRHAVGDQLLPDLHGHTAEAPADLSFGIAAGQHTSVLVR